MFRTLFLTAILLSAHARAQVLTPEKVTALREQFQKHQQQTKTWAATFTQTVSLPGMKQPVISTGSIAYRAREQLRLDFTKPAAEFVLVLGDQLFLQKAGKRVAVKSLSKDNAGKAFHSMLNLLQGQLTETEALYTPAISRQESTYSVVLNRKPDAPGRGPKLITNTIAADALDVREILVVLPDGGTIRYEFNGTTRNQPLADSLFAAPAVVR